MGNYQWVHEKNAPVPAFLIGSVIFGKRSMVGIRLNYLQFLAGI